MLGTRTFREGGVMIRWLGPLGPAWAPAIMPLHYFVLIMVVFLGLYFDTLHFGVSLCALLNVFLYMWL